MARSPRPWPAPLLLAVGALLAACNAQTAAPQKVTPAPAAAEAVEAVPAAPEPEAKAAVATPPPLSEEDLALIAADPATLTPEMRRKRAYARRRQIMQNPDSPTARALNDLVQAHQAGDIDIHGGKGQGTWLSVPGSKPTSGRPPAGWRPSDGPADAQGKPAPGTNAPSEPGEAAAEP